MTDLPRPFPRVPAHVEPYVEALGFDLAVTFLLQFGGAELYIRRRSDSTSELASVIGTAGVAALARHADHLPRRVPLAKPWLASVLAEQGRSVPQIARAIRASDVSVKRWLAKGPR